MPHIYLLWLPGTPVVKISGIGATNLAIKNYLILPFPPRGFHRLSVQ